jgi:hypothetical protein
MDKVKDARMPNLSTILMIEDIMKKSKSPISIPELKNAVPKMVMHQTLKIALAYLWESKKIEYTPQGIRWIFEKR